jgi:ABC-type antimicrobial peptide transport system permease subunit
VAPGLLAGITLAFLGNRLISDLLFEVEPGDPAALVMVSAGVVFAAFAASFLPAFHASRRDPLISLRQD